MELPSRLYELRKRYGLSQEKLAEALNVSRQSVSRWELVTASPSVENLAAISALYQMSLDELLGGTGTSAPDARKETAELKKRHLHGWLIALIYVCFTTVALCIGILCHAITTILMIFIPVSIG